MRPSHRLDVILLPEDPETVPIGPFEALWQALAARRIVAADGTPGPAAGDWVQGGFARLHLDRPGAVALYANRQGGFSVTCPHMGALVTSAFAAALTRWRSGAAPRRLRCPACGDEHGFDELVGRPPFAFASLALVTADAGAAQLQPASSALVQHLVGAVRTVLRRT